MGGSSVLRIEGRALVGVQGSPVRSRPASPTPALVRVGIDAAITANHHVCVRAVDADGTVSNTRFMVPPTLAGLRTLGQRLSGYPGVVAVAEPTSMTWLPLALALQDCGGQLSLVGSRHSARLRGAIMGKNKSDVIDADVLARAGEVFDLVPLVLPSPQQLAPTSGGDPPGRGGDRREPVSTPADLAGPVGVPGCVERVRWVAADRDRGPGALAASAGAGHGPPGDSDRGRRRAHPRGLRRPRQGRGDPRRRRQLGRLLVRALGPWTRWRSTSPST